MEDSIDYNISLTWSYDCIGTNMQSLSSHQIWQTTLSQKMEIATCKKIREGLVKSGWSYVFNACPAL